MAFSIFYGAEMPWKNAVATQPDANFVSAAIPGLTEELRGQAFYTAATNSFNVMSSKYDDMETFFKLMNLGTHYCGRPDKLTQEEYEMSQVSLSQQLKEGNLFAEQCPSREVLKHVTSRWGVLILVALREGTHRFSDLRRKIGGVSEKMLAQSLQALEQDGFLNRIAYPVVPPHVEYSLTPLGEQVSEKVAALADWIELNLPEVLAVRDERAA